MLSPNTQSDPGENITSFEQVKIPGVIATICFNVFHTLYAKKWKFPTQAAESKKAYKRKKPRIKTSQISAETQTVTNVKT